LSFLVITSGSASRSSKWRQKRNTGHFLIETATSSCSLDRPRRAAPSASALPHHPPPRCPIIRLRVAPSSASALPVLLVPPSPLPLARWTAMCKGKPAGTRAWRPVPTGSDGIGHSSHARHNAGVEVTEIREERPHRHRDLSQERRNWMRGRGWRVECSSAAFIIF
jgi:hypothetical protein